MLWTDGAPLCGFTDYFGTLETTLVQGSSSTTLNLRLTGVPVGKEDETERNVCRSSSSIPLVLPADSFCSFAAIHLLPQRSASDRVSTLHPSLPSRTFFFSIIIFHSNRKTSTTKEAIRATVDLALRCQRRHHSLLVRYRRSTWCRVLLRTKWPRWQSLSLSAVKGVMRRMEDAVRGEFGCHAQGT